MSKKSIYGIASLKLTAANGNSFPKFDAADGVFGINAIVKDSFKFNDSAPGDTDIEVEDSEEVYLSLTNGVATKGFTVDTYDLSADSYKYLMGWKTAGSTDTENAGFEVETPGYELPNQAVQLITKKIGTIPAFQLEWANMKTTVVQAGTIGKNGLPNLTLTFKKQPIYDATTAAEKPGARKKELA